MISCICFFLFFETTCRGERCFFVPQRMQYGVDGNSGNDNNRYKRLTYESMDAGNKSSNLCMMPIRQTVKGFVILMKSMTVT